MPSEKLSYEDPRWKTLRIQVAERANYKCQACERPVPVYFEVHHIAYHIGRMAWDYSFDELLCLCQGCHEQYERTISRLRWALRGMTLDQFEHFTEQVEQSIADHGPSNFYYGVLQSLPTFKHDEWK